MSGFLTVFQVKEILQQYDKSLPVLGIDDIFTVGEMLSVLNEMLIDGDDDDLDCEVAVSDDNFITGFNLIDGCLEVCVALN